MTPKQFASPPSKCDMPTYARSMKTFLSVATALLLLQASSSAEAKTPAAKLAYFENHVRPLLSEHCFQCHNDKKQEGGLRLDHGEAIRRGGESGTAVIAGKPEESLLIEAVRYEGMEMPPESPLEPEQIAKLVRWVKEGAVWPADEQAAKPSLGDQDAIRKAADSHWAFRPIETTIPPTPSDPDWGRHPIDRFVLAKLEANGLSPSAPAKRPTLIRRAFFDLIGLPPTPEVVQSVFGDDGLDGKTYKEIVEGLLESQHYGERMARHWMDVARYADTRDFLAAADLRYPFAYTYRDWLIQAFHSDLPYNEFVRQQLAADFLKTRDDDPNLAALGFLTVGPLFRNNTLERSADRIDVVTRGLMGLTGSCARCHDHKYDPISIEDYYSLYGVFRDSVRPKDFPRIDSPLGGEIDERLVREFEKALRVEQKKLLEYESGLAQAAAKEFAERPTEYLLGYLELKIERSETTRGLKSKRKIEETAMTPIEKGLDKFRADRMNASHPVLGPLVSLIAVPDKEFAEARDAYLKKHGKSLAPGIFQVVEKSSTRRDLAENLGEAFADAAAHDNPDNAAIRQWVVSPDRGPFVITPKAASSASRLLGKGRQALLKFQQAIADVEAEHPGAPAKAMALEDSKTSPPLYVLFRGEAARRGPKVEKRFPSYFANQDTDAFVNGSGRLELADSIVSPENPLTGRVIANRIWRMHFGSGLVDDAGDFGLRSEEPVHLPLLDWLALSLRQHDWSLKWLHKTIMLSNTYRQASSAMTPPQRDDGTSATEIDSANQLYWRQNRRRLDFESMRDGVLASAGTLDPKIGGRSVKLSDTPHPTRRSLYAYVDRVDPDALFATFDVPSPDVSSAQRTETLVPQQALFAMNNPFVTDQARAMTRHPEFQNAKTDTERSNLLMQRVLQRNARPNEVAMFKAFVEEAATIGTSRLPVWSYGYGDADSESFRDNLHLLERFDGNRYTYENEFPSPTLGFTQLSRAGGHPGRNIGQSSIRRWTAPDDMKIRLAGTLHRPSERGDGIRALIRINGRLISEWTVMSNATKTACGFHDVKQGDVVDFIVDPLESSTSDGYRWTVLIEDRSEGAGEVIERWHSAEDFGPPPPPPLTPWEQAAQALLMTNEFLFVD